MCTPFCECPLDQEKTWTAIPEKTLREYGRIATWEQATPEEVQEIVLNGPFDASVIALKFGLPHVSNFMECYNENLKPMFENDKNLPEG